jgi:hypothetical protein
MSCLVYLQGSWSGKIAAERATACGHMFFAENIKQSTHGSSIL